MHFSIKDKSIWYYNNLFCACAEDYAWLIIIAGNVKSSEKFEQCNGVINPDKIFVCSIIKHDDEIRERYIDMYTISV